MMKRLISNTTKTTKEKKSENNDFSNYHEYLYGINSVSAALLGGKRKASKICFPSGTIQPKNLERNPKMKWLMEIVKEKKIHEKTMTKNEMHKFTQGKAHQNVLLRCTKLNIPTFSEFGEFEKYLTKPTKNVFLILNEIQDPHNLGVLIRTAYFLGADGCLITTPGSSRVNPTVSKVSAGATEFLPLYKIQGIAPFLRSSSNQNWKLIGTTCDSSGVALENIKVDQEDNIFLIFGNEGEGLEDSILNLLNYSIYISPKKMPHQIIDSLNVGVAAGIILSHLSALLLSLIHI
eukprot:TRINITY_DN10582_c0_g1_i1.p1 TRINITY_DN10582_c0_g1~~TRINITY_DN10582_c0_g1_i1.p1  ORF type:complete len:309 (-),score=53.88 TRINITY_DN10582_c0_g1_i1:169-1041(-)